MVGLGYSAGASSLSVARVAYARDPIVRGMVLMSGTPTVVNNPNNPGEFRRVAANAGCAPRGAATITATTTTTTTNNTADSTAASTTAQAEASNGSDSALDGAQQARLELECMKRVDAQELARAISNRTLNPIGSPAGGAPRIDDVLVFAPSEVSRRVQTGLVADIVS